LQCPRIGPRPICRLLSRTSPVERRRGARWEHIADFEYYRPSMPSESPGERQPQRTRRGSLAAEVGIGDGGSHSSRRRDFDLSLRGCKIEFGDRPAVGERVWVKFDGLGAIESSVRWVAGDVAGVQFDHPLHQAVFDRLAGPGIQPPAPSASHGDSD
jgi:hypothetical protein